VALRAVVFDFDGVLVDSEPLHFRALRDALAPEGVAIDLEEYARTYLSYTDRESIRIALEVHGFPYDAARVESVAERKARLFEDLLPSVPVFPGARELVVALGERASLAIASGARRAEIEAILAAAGLRSAFAEIVGADDVSHGKPDPEPYLAALRRLRSRAPALAPEQCLVIEDTAAGIASGRAAGMKVVGVTHTYPVAALAAAHRVVASLAEVEGAVLHGLFGE
jgi:HAD superfamily hydrolase (TIGR01509 family)